MSIKERKLTGGEKRSKEANFKKLKKVKGDFKDRYGKDAESVMHAVATNQAKNEDAEYKPHMMYKGDEKEYRAFKPSKKDHHDRLMGTGYDHDDPETKKIEEKGTYKSDPELSNLRLSDIPSDYEKRKYAARTSKINEDSMVDNFMRKVAAGADDGSAFDMLYDAPSGKYGPEVAKEVIDMMNSVSYDRRLHPDDDLEQIIEFMVDEIYDDYGVNEDISAELTTSNQRTQRILNLIRANNPTAKNDFEAILLSLAKAKKNLSNEEDQEDITQLRQEVDGLKLLHNQLQAKVDGLNESATLITEEQFDEAAGKKDACYHKVKSRYKVWPSAYASGALVQCRKKGAKNWGNSKK